MGPAHAHRTLLDALQTAVATRGGDVAEVIFHADCGSQSTSAAFARVCDRYGVHRSTGKVGSSYNIALAESLWQRLMREPMHKKLFATMCQAWLEIADSFTSAD